MTKLTDALQDAKTTRVLVDLQFPGLDIQAVATEVQGVSTKLPLIGYAQHVMTDLIEAARNAEFDQVMTRGQFDSGFMKVME